MDDKPEEGIAVGEPPPSPLPPIRRTDDGKDDETALARMLKSEDPDLGPRVVIGWITLQIAQRRKISVFKLLTGKPGEYGPQTLDRVSRYAATTYPPTPETREIARQLLGQLLRPSQAVRAHGASPWVEWLKPSLTKAERAQHLDAATVARLLAERNDRLAVNVLREQHAFGDRKQFGDFGGIWARIAGSRWFLFDKKTPITDYESRPGGPAAALEKIPLVEALDASSRRGQVS